MDYQELIGMRVMHLITHQIGKIEYIEDGIVAVDFYGEVTKFSFPSAFAETLELEDEELQNEIQSLGVESNFEIFRKRYKRSLETEIGYLISTGGKRYRIVDGKRILSEDNRYLYSFDSDMEMHFPSGTSIKLYFPDKLVLGSIVSCEDFIILIVTNEDIGEEVNSVEFSAEQWHLLESLNERLEEIDPSVSSIAGELACNGNKHISASQGIVKGQSEAFNRAMSEPITFIWGPPGTGKTETLAEIAIEHINDGNRVLMLSYSNVSVDGAVLRVAKKADFPDGMITRYGYPRDKRLLESGNLYSYRYVLQSHPEKEKEYQELLGQRALLKNKGNGHEKEIIEINKKIGRIQKFLKDEEKELIQRAFFVATTVSNATVDKAVYTQRFDVVIFDEASMAYVPQIVFASSLAKIHFVCLGDFYQLPPIVQNKTDNRLLNDIYDYTGIRSAVKNNCGHDWLVLLDTQYRMHHDIADFLSNQMYSGLLKTSSKISESRNEIASCHPCPNSAMTLVDLSRMYSVCIKTMDYSHVNLMSALVSLRLAEKNLDNYSVGIITPYGAQSRLILCMVRDLQQRDSRWNNVSCKTVHQFQGSEEPIIIYDAVDCFRLPYPGGLIASSTEKNHHLADRLFNVALSRAKGKFILVGNIDYFKRKNLSKKLLISKAITEIREEKHDISGIDILSELMPEQSEEPAVYADDKERSWKKYISDIKKAKRCVYIDVPDIIGDIDDLIAVLNEKNESGVDICIRTPEDVQLPEELNEFVKVDDYVTNPLTIIDRNIVWYGHPMCEADFISEGEDIETEYFPCLRFAGRHTTRFLQAIFEIKYRGE